MVGKWNYIGKGHHFFPKELFLSDVTFCHGWLGKADRSKSSACCVLCLLHIIHLLMMYVFQITTYSS